MLILVRKLDQRIRISHPDGDVWLQIVSVERDRVKLGFTAPPSVAIRREELVDAEVRA